MTGCEFTCLCGKMKGWITEGEAKKEPCPVCGRLYRGEYDPENLTIKAIEINPDEENNCEEINDRN
jgi:hypothetical protein